MLAVVSAGASVEVVSEEAESTAVVSVAGSEVVVESEVVVSVLVIVSWSPAP